MSSFLLANQDLAAVNGRELVATAFEGNLPDREIEGSPLGDAIVAFALPESS